MKKLRHALAVSILAAVVGLNAGPLPAQTKDAEPATRDANIAFIAGLPFFGQTDFDDAQRGFIATLPDGVIAGPAISTSSSTTSRCGCSITA